jgi:hypothetical protein
MLGDDVDNGDLFWLREEAAYEHWHRMLFARFLAENELLMMPMGGCHLTVSMAECHDLARERGLPDGWPLAADLAAGMLPQIFKTGSPAFRMVFPPEHRQSLEKLVEGLPSEAFTASDGLGWYYQFWQGKRKDESNASGMKIGARELPAVTQIFTKMYMVSFQLDNTLGAWWAGRRLSAKDLQTAADEPELRRKASLPGMPLSYLRFVRKWDVWTPVTGRLEERPDRASEIQILDPCCGSGHFLSAALMMIVPMRMAEEGLSPKDAVEAALRDNIYGLELDRRCVEIAAFSLAFASWTYPGSGGYRALPTVNIACSGIASGENEEKWRELAAADDRSSFALESLRRLFIIAPMLGSLIEPEICWGKGSVLVSDKNEIASFLAKALYFEPSDDLSETAIAALGIADASALLSSRYTLVITNVPFHSRVRQDSSLYQFCRRFFHDSSSDLAMVFLERCLKFCEQGGTVSLILPDTWPYLKSYRKIRAEMLESCVFNILALLGSRAFGSVTGEVVQIVLTTIRLKGRMKFPRTMAYDSATPMIQERGGRLPQIFAYDSAEFPYIYGIDVSAYSTADEKSSLLSSADIISANESRLSPSSDSIITFYDISNRHDVGKTGFLDFRYHLRR